MWYIKWMVGSLPYSSTLHETAELVDVDDLEVVWKHLSMGVVY
jgi:hypothetical protein